MTHTKYYSPGDSGGGLDALLGGAASASPWGAAAAAIPSLYSTVAGIFQRKKASQMSANLRRPKLNLMGYNIPPEVQQYLDMEKNRMINPNLPGQGLMEDKLGANTSDAVAHATDPNQISEIYGKQMDAQNNLNIDAAKGYREQVDSKRGDVASALQVMAGFKDKKFASDLDKQKEEFDYNQNQPYQKSAADISALLYGSNKNVYGGLNGLSNIASGLMYYKGLGGNRGDRFGGYGQNSRVLGSNEIPSSGAPAQSQPDLFGASGYGY